jgi:septal ring factor EnvC (AmiA/AmiB activator)
MGDPLNERIDEVAADLAELRREVRAGFAQVQTEFAAVRVEFAAEQEKTRTELRAEFAAGHAALRAEFAAEQEKTRTELRAEFAAERVELRRHFDVVAEDLRATIRLLAEGLSTLNQRMDRFETRMAEQFAELRDMIRLSYTDLDRRVRVLEGHAGV